MFVDIIMDYKYLWAGRRERAKKEHIEDWEVYRKKGCWGQREGWEISSRSLRVFLGERELAFVTYDVSNYFKSR